MYESRIRRTGIVDLGSNTARLVVFAYEPGHWFRLIDEIREPVRLGESLGRSGKMSAAGMERAAAALRLYAKYCQAMELEDVRVIATSAVRDAANREEFLEMVRPYGLPIEVLPGEEEAALGVSAVANGFPMDDAWVMDLGGGSMQISRMRERTFVDGRAFPLGAVRVYESFLSADPPSDPEVEALESRAEAELNETVGRMRRESFPLVAMGGSIRNLTRAVQKKNDYPLDRIHGFFLQRGELETITYKLLHLRASQRSRVPGIHPDRGDIIVAAALVYRWLLRQTDRDGIWVSGQGVREGAFYKIFLPAPHWVSDIRSFSVRNLFAQFPQSEFHTQQVRRLALRLFQELDPLHKLSQRDAELLEAACWLHDIGMTLGYHDHHKHGAYLVESFNLNGFTHREQALLALLVRYHRKGKPKWKRLKALARPGDKRKLLQLSCCLRLAEFLERSRSGRVRDVKARISGKKVAIALVGHENPFIELWETRKQSELFQQAFKKKLTLDYEKQRTPASAAPRR
ncbi:MAG TPA: Ppx/GppA phosphatase family protein [Acidobacteriota bacterium]|nr:Ppx/GppA phosphatase family protein [Acidobacteriota bacterium]